MAIDKLQFVVSVDVFANAKSLSTEEQKLMQEAEKAMKNAYAPYSEFKVGAAVLLDNGTIVTGNNQENAAYPSGMCAERVALFYAGSQYPKATVKAIAIVCGSDIDDVISPCGACRQVIAEYEQLHGKKIRLLMGTPGGKIFAANSIETLLPLMFGKKHLKK